MRKSLSLVELSSIQVAKGIWKDREVKKSFIQLITPDRFGPDLESRRKELMIIVEDRIKKLNLPVPLQNHILAVMNNMGIILKEYLEFGVTNKVLRGLDLETLLDHISWTPFGTIDRGATVRSLVRYLPRHYDTWVLLTSHCLTDLMKDYERSSAQLKMHARLARITMEPSDFMEAVFSHYWHQRNQKYGGSHKALIQLFNNFWISKFVYKQKYSIDENMLVFSFVYCNYEGVKYFWSLLNDKQRKESIINIMSQRNSVLFSSGRYDEIDLVQFLLKNVEFYKLNDYWKNMLKNIGSLNIFLKLPQLDSFMEIYEQAITLQSPIDFVQIFEAILSNISFRSQLFGFEDVYEDLFHELWTNLAPEHKRRINPILLITHLITWPRMEILKLIIYDEQFVTRRGWLLWLAMDAASSRYFPEDEFPIEFSAKVLQTEETRKLFETMIARKGKSRVRNARAVRRARIHLIGKRRRRSFLYF